MNTLCVDLYKRDFITPIDTSLFAFRVMEYSRDTDVGYKFATVRVYPLADRSDLLALRNWLRDYVVIRTQYETPLWAGFINNIRIHRGGIIDTVWDLDDMANRVNVLYNRKSSPASGRAPAETGWGLDADSVADYGRFELFHRQSGDSSDQTALSLRDSIIAERAYPRRGIEMTVGKNPVDSGAGGSVSDYPTEYAEIRCIGLIQALQYVYPSNGAVMPGVTQHWIAEPKNQWLGRVLVGRGRFVFTPGTPGLIEDLQSRWATTDNQWLTVQGAGNSLCAVYQAYNNVGGRFINTYQGMTEPVTETWRVAIFFHAWKLAQRVVITDPMQLSAISLYIARFADDAIRVSFCADGGTIPGAVLSTTSRSDIGGVASECEFVMPTIPVAAGTYWILVERENQTIGEYYPDSYFTVGIDPLGGAGGNLYVYVPDSGNVGGSVVEPTWGYWSPMPEQAYPASPANKSDLVFRITGAVDIADIVSATLQAHGQFIAAVEQRVTSGNYIIPYLDYQRRVLDELKRVMKFGTIGLSPLELEITADRTVIVKSRPTNDVDKWMLLSVDSRLYDGVGNEIDAERCRVGFWAIDMDDYPYISRADYDTSRAFYVRAAEYDAENNVCRYTLARNLTVIEMFEINPQQCEDLLPGMKNLV